MERFLSPGYKVKPPEPPEEPVRPRGRPAKEVLEGALDLGQQRVRRCGTRQKIESEQRIASLERKIEAINMNQ